MNNNVKEKGDCMAKISITDKNSDLIAFQNSSKIHSVTNDFSLGLLKEKVAKSIRELPVQERKLLYLYYYKALTQAEIAKLENISKQAVCLRLKKIIEKIQNIMDISQYDISDLTEREQKIFKLYYIKKIKIKTISTLLNISKSTVVSDLSKIKIKLQRAS